MYKQALAIDEALGRKEGMANAYFNLGIVHLTRGELTQAEAMYKNSLQL
jgi:Tfp pilus assembly protein PilF